MSQSGHPSWQYTVIEPPRGPTMEEATDPSATLNELGAEGWELVTTIEYDGGGTKYLVFKRPASATDE
ncbi:DUF4177 domain-containing protein [Natronorubrum sp. JWXQ-INN-674]|uniref:DUF4177 domain-containing protein n=1 Tax=Natronorubrum halalkaliphilum TaxID=2691917 RepID=A0A6B0VNB1_9EURY|nr:DUF4177 domain-containing protein [Natronorubrum halalkaliphilum]MXV62607.1 DUF4177 domain-containing protein [Natronorubrum halalkaliphilum]